MTEQEINGYAYGYASLLSNPVEAQMVINFKNLAYTEQRMASMPLVLPRALQRVKDPLLDCLSWWCQSGKLTGQQRQQLGQLRQAVQASQSTAELSPMIGQALQVLYPPDSGVLRGR